MSTEHLCSEGDAQRICERKLSLKSRDMVCDIGQDPPAEIVYTVAHEIDCAYHKIVVMILV